MTRSKLSDSDKQAILTRFTSGEETVNSLAQHYQVSASTIRRLLKQGQAAATPPEMEAAVVNSLTKATPDPPKKRSKTQWPQANAVEAENNAPPRSETLPASEFGPKNRPGDPSAQADPPESAAPESLSSRSPRRRIRHHGASTTVEGQSSTDADTLTAALSLDGGNYQDIQKPAPPIKHTEHELHEILEDLEDDLEPEDGSDFDADDEDGDDFDPGSDLDEDEADNSPFVPGNLLEVRSIDQAIFPETCYVVIDRTAELVTRPLKEFGALGQVAEAEVNAKTLPIFENHRVARRFSQRSQRVIKVPSGELLKKTTPQLSAKGITRLLMDGQIYEL